MYIAISFKPLRADFSSDLPPHLCHLIFATSSHLCSTTASSSPLLRRRHRLSFDTSLLLLLWSYVILIHRYAGPTISLLSQCPCHLESDTSPVLHSLVPRQYYFPPLILTRSFQFLLWAVRSVAVAPVRPLGPSNAISQESVPTTMGKETETRMVIMTYISKIINCLY